MDIAAVIAAKGTSMRVPNKNIKPFGNTNLLEHKINQLQQVNGLKNIYVNSESDSILKVASSAGAQILILFLLMKSTKMWLAMFLMNILCLYILLVHL